MGDGRAPARRRSRPAGDGADRRRRSRRARPRGRRRRSACCAAQDGVSERPRASAATRCRRCCSPWLGDAGLDRDLPLPAMIDVDLDRRRRARGSIASRGAVTAAAPACADRRSCAAGSAPLVGLIRSLGLLAGGIVALMAGATARGGGARGARRAQHASPDDRRDAHDGMRPTCRSRACSSAGSRSTRCSARCVGLVGAIVVILLHRAAAGRDRIGADRIDRACRGAAGLLLLALPILAGLLALAVARITVLRALARTL